MKNFLIKIQRSKKSNQKKQKITNKTRSSVFENSDFWRLFTDGPMLFLRLTLRHTVHTIKLSLPSTYIEEHLSAGAGLFITNLAHQVLQNSENFSEIDRANRELTLK